MLIAVIVFVLYAGVDRLSQGQLSTAITVNDGDQILSSAFAAQTSGLKVQGKVE
jgi:hypothetical protein